MSRLVLIPDLHTSRAWNPDQEGISISHSGPLAVGGWLGNRQGARAIMEKLESYCSELMRRANRGDAVAYRQLLQELASFLRRSARWHGSRCSPEDIEDAVQETLLALHLKRHTWDECRPLLPWIRAILQNKVTDALRRRGDAVHLSIDDIAETLADVPIEVASRVDTEVVLASLQGRQRDVVVSISIEGGSARQVAVRLGMTEVAVRVCLHRALKAMARRFRTEATTVDNSEHRFTPTPVSRGTQSQNARSSSLGYSMRISPGVRGASLYSQRPAPA